MRDLKMEGHKIVRSTDCKVGNHVFIWANGNLTNDEPPPEMICTCGLYRWDEWKKESDGN